MLKFRITTAILVVFASVGSAFGQFYPIKINAAKVGLPPGPKAGIADSDNSGPAYICKPNTWAPVYLELEIVGDVKKPACIVIETTDPDTLGVTTTVPLQNLTDVPRGTRLRAEELAYLPYFRVSNHEVTITVREQEPAGSDPTRGRLLAEPKRIQYLHHRTTSSYVVLSLGSKLSSFELPTDKAVDANNATRGDFPRVEQANIENVLQLPDRWYGYDAADLVILSTGETSVERFLNPLFGDTAHRARVDALFEWVLRGGRLLVSVGTNASIVSQYPRLQGILPMQIRGVPSEQVKELYIEYATDTTTKKLNDLVARANTTFPVANLAPHLNRGFTQLLPPTKAVRENSRQAIVQAPYGLGRVTLVAFDLDRSPFTEYIDKAKLWEYLVQNAGSKRSSQAFTGGSRYLGVHEDELAADLRGHTDWFAGVPVISFAWVALFIVLYTLLIGPVEYLLLKKVFKRLEWTWITFPIIVLFVSGLAYFSAYALKGTDLKLNKVDLIDIDPVTNRVYGHTWFTIFSPRIANYTVGIEPNEKWVAPGTESHGSALIDWTGASQSRQGSFFRRSYHYNLARVGDAPTSSFSEGLVDVPVQVWSTKALVADWSGSMDKTKPLVVSELNHPPSSKNKESVVGSFTLNLPFSELQDAYVIYAGKAYKWDTITSGVPVNVFLNNTQIDNDWLTRLMGLSQLTGQNQPQNLPVIRPSNQSKASTSTGVAPIFHLMFHDESMKNNDLSPPRNATLRRLDQSWRISPLHQNEIIVVGRAKMLQDVQIEDAMGDPATGSPTTIWLKELPNATKPRTKTPGKLQQETFVRIFIPVK